LQEILILGPQGPNGYRSFVVSIQNSNSGTIARVATDRHQ
jgi:hypothetical protein